MAAGRQRWETEEPSGPPQETGHPVKNLAEIEHCLDYADSHSDEPHGEILDRVGFESHYDTEGCMFSWSPGPTPAAGER